MKNETKYTLNDILNVIQKLPEAEKDFMLKRVSVSDILKFYNDRNEYCRLVKGIEDGMEEWELWKTSVESLYKELNKYDSDTVYKYANIKVAPEMDGYTFARMVSVVAKVTQRDLKHCCASIWAIINRLYILKEYPTSNFLHNEPQNDVEESKYLLEKCGIDFNKKVFWILSDIHGKWNDCSAVEKEAIAKAIVDVFNMENFLVLIDNWDRVDDPIPSSDIKAIMSEIKLNEDNKFFGIKDAMIDINNRWTESENFRGFLNSIHEMWDYLDDEQKNNITGNMAYGNYTGLVKAMLDIDESISKIEERSNG